MEQKARLDVMTVINHEERCIMLRATTLAAAASLVLVSVSTVLAQTDARPETPEPVACPSQQGLEQAIGSSGDIFPEDCTVINVSKLTSGGEELCLIDFGVDEGFLGRLRDVAMPSQWWVRCSDIEAALQ